MPITATTIFAHLIIILPLYDAASYLPVSSPRFGGCQTRNASTKTLSLAHCALKPSDCAHTANSDYIPPHKIRTTTQCNTPHAVTIGLCTSSLDKGLCSAFSESCTISPMFQPKVEACKLVQNQDDTRLKTRYPQCRIPALNGNPSVSRCVLNSEECMDGEEFLTIEHLPWKDHCHCHHVTTGMCHLDYTSTITADSSFCAVGAYDCPDGYKWMNSTQLLNMEDPPRSCLLCQEEDFGTGRVVLHESVVESGGCYATPTDADDVTFLRCALESSECDFKMGEFFKSSMQMYEMGHIPCPADDIRAGKCTSGLDSVGCTNRADACKVPSKFVLHDTCTMHSNKHRKEKTFYASCHDKQHNKRCVWGHAECDLHDGEEFHAAMKGVNIMNECICENVKTGACKHGSGADKKFYCAVSKLSCDNPSSYVSSRRLLKHFGLDCRLCQPKRKVFLPTISPKKRPLTFENNEEVQQPLDLAVLIGVSLGSMVLLTSLAVAVYYRKTKNESQSSVFIRESFGEVI